MEFLQNLKINYFVHIGHPGASAHEGTLPPHSLRSISDSCPIDPQLLSEVRYLSKLVLIELLLVTESKEGEESNKSKSALTFNGKIKKVEKTMPSLRIFINLFFIILAFLI